MEVALVVVLLLTFKPTILANCEKRLVDDAVVANELVEVAFVVVLLPAMKSVIDAVAEKKLVEVALVVVAFTATRFGNVLSVVVVAVKCEPTTSPATESFAYGVDVPMPNLLFTLSQNI